MSRELLKQVRVLDPLSNCDRIADVRIEDGRVRAVADQLAPIADEEVIALPDCVLAPGLVDLYSSSGEPGHEDRETLKTLRQAAQAGGITRLSILPCTEPPLDQPGQIASLQAQWASLQSVEQSVEQSVAQSAEQSAEQSVVQAADMPQIRLQPWGAVTQAAAGQQMTELAELAQANIIGFSDGQPLANLVLLRRLLEYVQPLQKPLALWACDRTLAGSGSAREGTDSICLGLPGNPALSETTALAAILECVAAVGTPIHLMRVSTVRSVELIHQAKDQGLPITASTTWLHLLCDSRDLASYDPNLRLEPPLGTPTDREALWQGLQSGIIDAIAIDHSPYTYEEKTVAFNEAPPGAIGLELALPLLWHSFVETGRCSALELWRWLSTHPARCLNQAPPVLQVDQAAELILFQPQATWTVQPSTLASRSHNTHLLNRAIAGKVLKIWA